MEAPQFVYPFIMNSHLGCFQFLVVVAGAALHTNIQAYGKCMFMWGTVDVGDYNDCV